MQSSQAAEPNPSGPQRSPWLWDNRGFNLYWFGETISVLGSALSTIAFPLVVIEATGSILRMGTLVVIYNLTALVTGLAVGPLVDRMDRRRLMIWAGWGRAAALCAIPAVWWLSRAQFWPLALAAFTTGILTTLFLIASQALLPALVGKSNVSRANARLEISFAVVYILGPALAGSLSSAVGPAAVVGFDGLTFVVSAIALTLAPAVARPPVDEQTRAKGLADSVAGFRALGEMPFLKWVVPLDACLSAMCLAAPNLLIFYLKQVLGHSDQTVGLVFGVAAVGAIVSGVSISWLRGRVGFRPLWLASFAVMSATFLSGGLAPALAGTIAVGVLFSVMQTARSVLASSVRQEMVPDGLQGRVSSAVWTLNFGAAAISNAGLTALAEVTSVPLTFAAMGVLAAALTLVAALTPAHARHPAPVATMGGVTPG